jgi:ribosomal protein S18 acetylase RimI-like enzyme
LHTKDRVNIVELSKAEAVPLRLHYTYTSRHYYDLSILHERDKWRIELICRPFDKPFEKAFDERLFEEHVEEPRAFAAVVDGEQVGWIELGYEKWSNRMRIWEINVKEGFRRSGVGTMLMDQAVKIAKERGARALVLVTQSCNGPAIDFYLKHGFELIGFDATAYNNDDVGEKEIRLELGLRLQP